MSALLPPRPRSPPTTPPPITSTTPPPRRRSRALAGDIPIDALGRRSGRIRRPRPIRARAPGSLFRRLDAVEQTSTGLLRRVEGVSTDDGGSAGGAGGHEGQADGLAFGVCAVEFADGEAGVGEVFVGYEGGAVGAAGAVVAEVEGVDGADAGEEVLTRGGFGWYGYVIGGGRGVVHTSRSSSVRS